jgi:hypothetical protein
MSACKEVNGVTEYGVYICDTANNSNTRTPENAANARLIAAAPMQFELIIALRSDLRQTLYEWASRYGVKPFHGGYAREQALDAAIAKAEGVEQ